MSGVHPNARRGLAEWNDRRRIERLHLRRLTPGEISIALDRSKSEVLAALVQLHLIPHPTFGSRLLNELDRCRCWCTTRQLVDVCASTGNRRQCRTECTHRALNRLVTAGFVVGCVTAVFGTRPVSYWASRQRCVMTLDEAKEMVTKGVEFGTVFSFVPEEDRELLKRWFVLCPGLPNKAARAASVGTANLCPKCQGIMVRTGSCETCQSCGGSSGGCG